MEDIAAELNHHQRGLGGYDKGCRVEVYDQFVVVTTSDGVGHVHPHGFYSGLSIKKD